MPTLYSRILSLTWPLILSNLAVPLLGIVDSAMLGHLDEPQFLAAAALGGSLIALIFSSLNFLRMSTTGLSAQAFGSNNKALQSRSLLQGLQFAAVLSLFLLFLSPFLIKPALSLMLDGQSSSLFTLACEYSQIRMLSAPATLINYVLVGWAIGQQQTKLAMLSLTATTVINIFLDYIFIVVFDFQAAGSAWATVIAEYVSLIICSFFIVKRHPWLITHRAHLSRGWRDYRHLFSLNQNLFIRSSCLLFVFAFFNAQSAKMGDAILAANAILLQLVMLQSYALDGFAHATEALVGQSAGNKSYALRNIYKATALCVSIAALLLVIFYIALQPHIAPLFTQQKLLIQYINSYLPWVIFLPLVSVWAYWLDGIAVGLSASKNMRNSLLIASFMIFLPCWYVTKSWGNHGLWLSFFVFSLARGVLLAPLLKNKVIHVADTAR